MSEHLLAEVLLPTHVLRVEAVLLEGLVARGAVVRVGQWVLRLLGIFLHSGGGHVDDWASE